MPAHKGEGLAVVLLLSDNPDRTAAFYRDVIGLDLVAEEHGGRHRHYGGTTGSVYFTIQYASDFAGTPSHGPDSMQLCFAVADLGEFLKHLEQYEVAALHEPRAFEHTTFVTLRDPDGRTLRVMTRWGSR